MKSFFRKDFHRVNAATLATILVLSSVVGALQYGNMQQANASLTSDFYQCANGSKYIAEAVCNWISSILNPPTATKYFEGMTVPQKVFIAGVTTNPTAGHTLSITYDYNKVQGGVDNIAYPFETTFDPLLADAATPIDSINGNSTYPDALTTNGAFIQGVTDSSAQLSFERFMYVERTCSDWQAITGAQCMAIMNPSSPSPLYVPISHDPYISGLTNNVPCKVPYQSTFGTSTTCIENAYESSFPLPSAATANLPTGHTLNERYITIYGAKLVSGTYVPLVKGTGLLFNGATSVPNHGGVANLLDLSTSETVSLTIPFKTSGCSATTPCAFLIYYGGSLAIGSNPNLAAPLASLQWGNNNGASNVSGGPYHQHLSQFDGASLGSQDNQIKSGAILVPPLNSVSIATKIVDSCTDSLATGQTAGTDCIGTRSSGATTQITLGPSGVATFHDTAQLDASISNNAGGTVDYDFYSGVSDCSLTSPSSVETKTVTNAVAADSSDKTLGVGDYSYKAKYNGDPATNNAASNFSACEPLTIVTPPQATITIVKATNPAAVNQVFDFGNCNFVDRYGNAATLPDTSQACTANTVTIHLNAANTQQTPDRISVNVKPGQTYTIDEMNIPNGWALVSIKGDSGTGNPATDDCYLTGTATATIVVPNTDNAAVTCTFTDARAVVKVAGFGYTDQPSDSPPTAGVASGSATYNIDAENFGAGTASNVVVHLTFSSTNISPGTITVTSAGGGTFTIGSASCTSGCQLEWTVASLTTTSHITKSVTISYANIANLGVINAQLTITYQGANGTNVNGSDTPANINFTVQSA